MPKDGAAKTLKSIGVGLFSAAVLVWGLALLAVYPTYTIVAVAAAVVTFVLAARQQARSLGRKHAAEIAARADAWRYP